MRVLIYKINNRYSIEVYGTNAIYAYCNTRAEVDTLVRDNRLLVMYDYSGDE